MTELLDALADTSPEARDQRARRVAAAFYEAIVVQDIRQAALARRTGLSRETIRRYVEDERIRRGELDPTPRYLAEQERRAKRTARES